MSETIVVHVNSQEWRDTPEDQRVYIGRAVPRRGFKASKWANPFKIDAGRTREESLLECRQYVRDHPTLLDDIEELRGKVLGCWCKAAKPGDEDRACHGDIYVFYLEMLDQHAESILAEHPELRD